MIDAIFTAPVTLHLNKILSASILQSFFSMERRGQKKEYMADRQYSGG
jgi:hypothetical protein